MSDFKGLCFVIMPFAVELRYFYLFLKQYTEQKHNLRCERADDQILTIPVLDKINDYIQKADVIIADCTGNNPNVFYELGIAHAHGKKVILITRDSPDSLPFDVRPFDFITYGDIGHVEFLGKLDNALYNIFSGQYSRLYIRTRTLFAEFQQATQLNVHVVSEEQFREHIKRIERNRNFPDWEDVATIAYLALPAIIEEIHDLDVSDRVNRWRSENYGES